MSMPKVAAKKAAPKQKSTAAPKAAPAPVAKPKAAAKKAAPAKKAAAKPKTATKKMSSHEATLARVESVRLMQRSDGHFDCFGRADSGFCDQGGCSYHAECLSISRMLL